MNEKILSVDATHELVNEIANLKAQVKVLREALDYMYRYFVMPGHPKLAKDCPNKSCPFCKAIDALDAGEPRKEGSGK